MSFRGPPDISNTHSLLVLNISFRTRAEDLRQEFSRFGELADIYIPRSRGESRGYAFVRYYNKHDADEARSQMDKVMLDNREIGVQFAKYGRQAQQQNNRRRPRSPFGRSRSPPSRGRGLPDDRYGRDRRSPRRYSPRRFDNDGGLDSRRRSFGNRDRGERRNRSPDHRERSPYRRERSPYRRERSPDRRERSPDRRERSPDRKRSRNDDLNGSVPASYNNADPKRALSDNDTTAEREHRIDDGHQDNDRNGRVDRDTRHDRRRDMGRDHDYEPHSEQQGSSPSREPRRGESINPRHEQRGPMPAEPAATGERDFAERSDTSRERELGDKRLPVDEEDGHDDDGAHDEKPESDMKKEDLKLPVERDAPLGSRPLGNEPDLGQAKDVKYEEEYQGSGSDSAGRDDAPSHHVEQPWSASPANAEAEDGGGERGKHSR